MKKSIIVLSLLSTLISPIANSTALIFGGWSDHHVENHSWCYDNVCHDDFNEVNTSYGIEYNNFSIVSVKNSYNKQGVVLFYTYEPEILNFKYAEFGVRLGCMTGYKDTVENMEVAPLFAPVVEIKPFADIEYMDHFHVETSIIPMPDNNSIGYVITTNLKLTF